MTNQSITIPALELDGVKYDTAQINEIRNAIIGERDEALKDGLFDAAVSLSHVAALLAHLAMWTRD